MRRSGIGAARELSVVGWRFKMREMAMRMSVTRKVLLLVLLLSLAGLTNSYARNDHKSGHGSGGAHVGGRYGGGRVGAVRAGRRIEIWNDVRWYHDDLFDNRWRAGCDWYPGGLSFRCFALRAIVTAWSAMRSRFVLTFIAEITSLISDATG
jgi:hypothetical protein